MIRRPPRSTLDRSSAASDVYKRQIQARNLSAEDFGGAALEGCNENLNLTRPDVIRGIHQAYLDAGADLISTNSFGCAPYVLAEYALSDKCEEICRAAGRIAREAADAGS